MKLISTDLDGTLMFRKNRKPYFKQEDVQALQSFHEQGHVVVVNSGRGLPWLTTPLDGVVNWDYLIACSGSCILSRDGDIIYGNALDASDIQGILDAYPTHVEISFNTKDEIYALRCLKDILYLFLD